ncbi:type II secretion system protein GspD [Thermosipho atlanticus]|uniref:Type II secretory pathway component GspD/PulD (Secretin) n=1 Tax=Thermosipho atlanticus DSM 15807 TaxID=1123380 RepID=A0A1M5SSF8_9BACT|nr:type II and III secretion system protein [Thermosipho atlanticus]SHH41238.1 Type II secretory pathway component GspD/PulD (secretin) [Thermosipho atlanticus DSM 15807]
MKKYLIFLMLVLFVVAVFSKVVNITYYVEEEKLVVLVELDHEAQPTEVNFGWNESQTVYYLELSENYVSSNSFLPVSKGPLEGIQIINTSEGINVFLFMLLPTKLNWYVLNNKIFIEMPLSISDKTVDYSFINAPLDVVARELSSTIGVDVSLYESVRNMTVNLDVSNATIEEAFRQFLLNNPDISYAFTPDKKLFLGTPEEISKNFARYWYVYDGKVNVDKIKTLLGSGTFIHYLKDKAKIFVYGGVREHRMIADAISLTPTESWHYFSYLVDENTLQEFLNNIMQIYEFKFVILKSLKQVAIYSDNEVANMVGYYISILKTEEMVDEMNLEKIKVGYPERIKTILDNLGIKNNLIGEYVEVPKKYTPLVLEMNKDRVIGNPYRLVLEDVYFDTVKNALDYLNISAENSKVTENNGKVFVTLFVTEEKYNRFLQFIDIASTKTIKVKVERNLISDFDIKILSEDENGLLIEGKEKVIDEVLKFVKEYNLKVSAEQKQKEKENIVNYTLNLLPTDPNIEVFEVLLNATPTYYTKEYAIFEINKDELESFKNAVDNIRQEFGKKIQFIDGFVIDESLKTLVKELYDVDVLDLQNGYLLKGIKVDQAINFITNYARREDEIKEVTKLLEITLENSDEIVKILKEIYNIDSIYFPGIRYLYMKGKSEAIEKAIQFVQSIEQQKVKSKIKILNLSATEQLKNVLSEVADLQIYTYQNKTILYGTEESINKAEEIIDNLISKTYVTKIETNLDFEKIKELVNFLYGDEVSVISIGNKVYFKGPKIYIDDIINQINMISESEKTEMEQNKDIYVENGLIYVDVKDYQIDSLIDLVFKKLNKAIVFKEYLDKQVSLNLNGVTFEKFVKVLEKFGIVLKEENGIYYVSNENAKNIYISDGKIFIDVVDAPLTDVAKTVYSDLGFSIIIDGVDEKLTLKLDNATLEDFENVIKEKVDIVKEGQVVFIKPKVIGGTVEGAPKYKALVEYSNGLFSIDAEDVPMDELIKEVMKKIGYSAIISKNIDIQSNIYAKNITFDNFINILNNYNISVNQKEDIYFFEKATVDATQNTNMFVFSVPRGSEKVKELVSFYGGQSFVDTESGMVIATGISAKNAAEIKDYINNLMEVKLAAIEVRVIDEDMSDNIEIDLGKLSTGLGEISSGGLNINLALSDLSFEKIAEKILNSGNSSLDLTNSSLSKSLANSNVVANPNVVAKSGETANIVIGDKLPIILTDAEGNETIQYLQSGVILEITPFINADDTIDLKLRIEVSTFDWELGATSISKLPVERTREFTSTLTLKDGQTLIIGGLTRDEKIVSTNKLPILGDLPIIGKFFSRQVEKFTKRNLIIFITAKVVK